MQSRCASHRFFSGLGQLDSGDHHPSAGGQEATPESINSDVSLVEATSDPDRYPTGMGEHAELRFTGRPRIARKRPKETVAVIGRRLLEIVVYDKQCRIGAT